MVQLVTCQLLAIVVLEFQVLPDALVVATLDLWDHLDNLAVPVFLEPLLDALDPQDNQELQDSQVNLIFSSSSFY